MAKTEPHLQTLSEAVLGVVFTPLGRSVQEVEILGSHVDPILVAGSNAKLPSDLGDGQVFVRHQEEFGIVNF